MDKRLIELIKMLNINQRYFASKIGVNAGNLNGWLKNKTKPGADALFSIYKEFNVNINWLLTGQGEIFIQNENNKKILPPFPDEKRKPLTHKFMWILFNMIEKLDEDQRQKLISIIATCFDQEMIYSEEQEEKQA